MKKKDKYTAEEIFKWLDGMLDELSDMMERCDEKRSIGIIYAFAHLTDTAEGEGVSAAAMNYDGEAFGGGTACVCALAAFLKRNKDLARIATRAQMIDTNKIFGI